MMEHLYPWHKLASDLALAYALTEDNQLQIATELNKAIQTSNVQCWQENGDPIRGAVPFDQIRRRAPHLTVAEGNAWLKRNGYLQEWVPLQSVVSPALALGSPSLDSLNRIQAERKTWRDVAWGYVVKVFTTGKYTTAKDLYRALEQKIGTPESPFEMGIGSNRHSLFLRDISKSVSLKTIQNCWAEIKSAHK